MSHLVVQPAYGRDYKSKKAVLEDWDAGKDFRVATIGPDAGRYINKQDADRGNLEINVRYNSDRSVPKAATNRAE